MAAVTSQESQKKSVTIFTLYGSNDVFPHNDGPFGGLE